MKITKYLIKRSLADHMATTDHEPSRQHIARAMSALQEAGWMSPAEDMFACTEDGSLYALGSNRHTGIIIRAHSALKGGWHVGCVLPASEVGPEDRSVRDLPGLDPKPFGQVIDLWIAMLLTEEAVLGWLDDCSFNTDTIREVLGEDAVQQLQLAMTPAVGAA